MSREVGQRCLPKSWCCGWDDRYVKWTESKALRSYGTYRYEMDFNSQLDNGVYNRFVENSPKNNEDGEKAQEELISNESVVSSARDDEDLNLRNLEILLSEG